jgi:predicted GH43/DUF377 family glycosyl hydrolase
VEDPRLFHHQNRLWMSYTVSTFPAHHPKCVIQYCELVTTGADCKIGAKYQVKYGHNDFTGMEKNHVFFEQDGRLYCIYQNHPERIVLEVRGNDVATEHRSPALTWPYGELRGGTEPLPFGDNLVQFCHSRTYNGKREEWWRYYTLALVMEKVPPFKILQISRQPVIAGHEWKPHDCFHAKHNVAIPYGAIADGQNFVVSIGLNDATCCVSRLNAKQLRL